MTALNPTPITAESISAAQHDVNGWGYRRVYFHANGCYREVGPRGAITDHIEQYRVNGQLTTWKRITDAHPLGDFRLPIKWGFYGSGCGAITPQNASEFHFEEDCPIKDAPVTVDGHYAKTVSHVA